MKNTMVIDSRDNVGVAIEEIPKGHAAVYTRDGEEVSLPVLEDIAIYHKVALWDIAQGEPVIKYGEHIGVASCGIKAGEHVHTHNVADRREALEVKE